MKTGHRVIAHRPEARRRCVACARPWPCSEVADATVELEPIKDPADREEPLSWSEIGLLVALGAVIVAANVMIVLSALQPARQPW